jgi:hypothetical protein
MMARKLVDSTGIQMAEGLGNLVVVEMVGYLAVQMAEKRED